MVTVTLTFTDETGAAAYPRILDAGRQAGAVMGEVQADRAPGHTLREYYKDGKILNRDQATRI